MSEDPAFEYERAAAIELIRDLAEGNLKPEHVGPYSCDLMADHWPRIFTATAELGFDVDILQDVLEAVSAVGAIDLVTERICRLAVYPAAGAA